MARYTEALGLVLLVAGTILSSIAIATTQWSTFGGNESGLWRYCPAVGGCLDADTSDSLTAARVTLLAGLIVSVMGIVVMMVALVVTSADGVAPRWVQPAVAGAGIGAGVLTLTGINIYNSHVQDDISTQASKTLGFSFWLSVAAVPCFLLAATVHILGFVRAARDPEGKGGKTRFARGLGNPSDFPFGRMDEKEDAPSRKKFTPERGGGRDFSLGRRGDREFSPDRKDRFVSSRRGRSRRDNYESSGWDSSPRSLSSPRRARRHGYGSPSPMRRHEREDYGRSYGGERRYRSLSTPRTERGRDVRHRRSKSYRVAQRAPEVVMSVPDFPAHMGPMLSPNQYPVSVAPMFAPNGYPHPLGPLVAQRAYQLQPVAPMFAPLEYQPPVATMLPPEAYAAPVPAMLVPRMHKALPREKKEKPPGLFS